jgi:hypothetical protein
VAFFIAAWKAAAISGGGAGAAATVMPASFAVFAITVSSSPHLRV